MSIAIAKDRLLQSLDLAQKTELQLWEHLRDVGRDFVELKEKIAAEKFKIKPWVRQNLPRCYEWLQSHVRLHAEWPRFLTCLKWADDVQYPRNERPSLMVAYDLMDEYDRDEVRSRSRRPNLDPVTQERRSVTIPPLVIEPSVPLDLTPTTTVICGDRVAMAQQHVASGSIDVATLDVPYRLKVPEGEGVTDYYLRMNGEKPRFREDWDRFGSLGEYEEFCSASIDEAMRCLDDNGSLFLHGCSTNIHIIGRLLQIKGISIINDIAWIKRNTRPNLCRRRLHHTNEAIIWAVKNVENFRFNYRRCKLHHDPRDYFSKRGRQMRDVWDIVTRPGNGHPSPKPIELYTRMLDVAGEAGGTLLELFCGAGPGAVAALRWGMQSISIDQDPRYLSMLAQRVRDEQQSHRELGTRR
jgi:DNA modification methylase